MCAKPVRDDSRCGPSVDGAACKVAGAYCNEATGWCGLTEAHKNGSTGAFDF